MDEDATWYGRRPQPRPQCVRRGPSSSLRKGHSILPLSFHVYCDHGRPSHLLLSSYTNGRPETLCCVRVKVSPDILALLFPSFEGSVHKGSISRNPNFSGNEFLSFCKFYFVILPTRSGNCILIFTPLEWSSKVLSNCVLLKLLI